jgi:hypothetical protein
VVWSSLGCWPYSIADIVTIVFGREKGEYIKSQGEHKNTDNTSRWAETYTIILERNRLVFSWYSVA